MTAADFLQSALDQADRAHQAERELHEVLNLLAYLTGRYGDEFPRMARQACAERGTPSVIVRAARVPGDSLAQLLPIGVVT